MYPRLALLLETIKHGKYTFVRVCPYALADDAVKKLADYWSSAVIHKKVPVENEHENAKMKNLSLSYLDSPENFALK